MNQYNNYPNQPQSSADWESQQAYNRIWAEEQLKTQNYQPQEQTTNQNFEKPNTLKRDLKRLGFAVFSIIGVATSIGVGRDTFIEPGTTVDDKIGYRVKMNDTKIKGLDNDNPYQEFIPIQDAPEKITLETGSPIRTNDWSYKNMPKRERKGKHTEIATIKEDLEFEIPSGAVYGNNGRIGVRIEDLEKTADGRYTGIKSEVDKDGWVFVNIEPEER